MEINSYTSEEELNQAFQLHGVSEEVESIPKNVGQGLNGAYMTSDNRREEQYLLITGLRLHAPLVRLTIVWRLVWTDTKPWTNGH